MKLRIVGGPIAAATKVFVEVDANETIEHLKQKAEESVGSSLAALSLFKTEIVEKKVKAAGLLPLTNTVQACGLKPNAIVMLKSGSGGNTPRTPRDGAAQPAVPPIKGMPQGQRSYRDRVIAFYEKYDKSKVAGVDATLAKFKGQEEAVIATLIKKYGPEPVPGPQQPGHGAGQASPAGSPRTYRDRVVAIYEKYDKSKLPQVDATLAKFKGKEEAVIATLVKKYGPEPESESAAATADPAGSPAATPREDSGASGSPRTYRDRVVAIYEKYDKSKLPQVDATLAKFKGKEEAVIATLVKKYGPEPAAEVADSGSPAGSPSATVRGDSVASSAPRSYRDRVVAIYEKYDKSKLPQVDATLAKFKGKEEAVIATLVKKYGPEPVVESAPDSGSPAGSPSATPREDSGASASPRTYRDRVVAIYEKYDKSKLPQVDATLAKFKGKEEAVIATLVKKYGPEPVAERAPEESSAENEAPSDDVVEPPPPTRADTVPMMSATPPSDTTPLETPREETPVSQDQFENSAVPTPSSPNTPVAPTAPVTPTHDEENITNSEQVAPPGRTTNKIEQSPRDLSRLKNVVACAVRSMQTDAEEQLARRAVLKWMTWANEQVIAKEVKELLTSGVWEEAESGFVLADDKTTVVDSVAAELSRRKSMNLVPNKDLHNAIGKLGGLGRGRAVVIEEATQIVSDSAARLEELKNAATERDKLTAEIEAAHNARDAAVKDAAQQAREAAEAQSSERNLSRRLEEVSSAYATTENELEKAIDQIERMKPTITKLRGDLERERRGIPSDVEQEIAAKDEKIATLHQQVAKLRTLARTAKQRENELLERLEGAKPRTPRHAVRAAQKSPSPQGTATRRDRAMDDAALAVIAQSAARSDDAEFAPDIDEEETEEDNVMFELPGRGMCPLCGAPLTAFFGNQYGVSAADKEKVAFCFSCRSSFSARDLRIRDHQDANKLYQSTALGRVRTPRK